jgi:tripartite-type tricarboxylate transporter receptor subunit TctC
MVKSIIKISLFALTFFIASAAVAQTYPTKPIRIMVGSAGSTADFMARYIGQLLSQRWGMPVVVENRPGVSATVAAAAVTKATPNGYTLLMGETASLANSVTLYQNLLQYDPIKDFAAITLVVKAPLVVVAHPSVQATTLRELIEYIKQHPQKINYASGGSGTASHLTTALLAQSAGIDIVHVPYKGAGAAVLGIIGGEVQISSLSATTAMPQIKAGRMKAYAVTGRNRFPTLPEIPTGIEEGLPAFESEVWFGLLAPKRTPEAIVSRLNKEVVEILNTPETKTAFLAQGGVATPTSPQEFARFMQSEIIKWAKVIKTAGIRVD